MKKLVHIFLFIGIINTLTFAEITKDDVEEYSKISRGGIVVRNYFIQRYKRYFSIIYGEEMQRADKAFIKEYNSFISNPKYINDFYEVFSYLDDNSFYEIIEFYKTNLGKKYFLAFEKIYTDGTGEKLMYIMMKNTHNQPLHKIRKLVSKINNALYSRYYTDIKRGIFTEGSPSGEYLFISNKKITSEQYLQIFNALVYKDFSDDELEQILKYAKTYGKIEMGFLDYALRINKQHFKNDLEKFIRNKKYTQNYEMSLSSQKAQTR